MGRHDRRHPAAQGPHQAARFQSRVLLSAAPAAMSTSFPDVHVLSALEDDAFETVLTNTLAACAGAAPESELPRSSKAATKAVISALSFAARCSFSAIQLRDEATAQGVSAIRAEALAVKYQDNLRMISDSMMSQTLQANQVVDLQWSFGVTASNSEMNKVATSFIHLKLVLDKGNGELEHVPMELSISQFYSFLQEMEKAKSIIDFL